MPSTLIQLLDALLGAYSLILLGKAIVSWFPVNPYNPIVRFLDRLTEPVLTPVRKKRPTSCWDGSFSCSGIGGYFDSKKYDLVILSCDSSAMKENSL